MINADVLIAAEQRRLAWRCRRGLLELDIILQRFVQTRFKELTMGELAVFDELLDLPDGEFWQIVQSQESHQDPRIAQMVALINATGQTMNTEER